MNNITIPLLNKTGLDSTKYTIYVLGFSPTSKKFLSQKPKTTAASFVDMPSENGTIPAYMLGTDLTEIVIDKTPSTTNPKEPAHKVDGARIYFFIAENSTFPHAPIVTYSNYGLNVQNVKNPPNTSIPPYTFAEFTLVNLSYGAVIDSQTVDGFVFPVTLSLNNDLGQIGQPLTINREAILKAYKPFMLSLGSSAVGFDDLQYSENGGGLLNPGAFLNDISDSGEFKHLDSPLNAVFDADLDTLFSNNALSIQGVANGAIATDVYTATSGKQPLPSGPFSQQALQFKGKTTGEIFNIYSPVGLCVLNTSKNGVHTPITGTIKATSLSFESPLPANTPLCVGMYVQGAGVPSQVTIKNITKNEQQEIIAVTLSTSLGQPEPKCQYRFSKLNSIFLTSGNMVFGNHGVFAYTEGVSGDGQAVLLNLQNQMVTALNRGVANLSPNNGKDGYSTKYWGTQTNWYPETAVQNLFSLFMHTATVSDNTPIFMQDPHAAKCARGTTMGQSYGFAYDENAGPVPPAPVGQPEVPSKYDPLPSATTTVTITLGPWNKNNVG